MVLNTMNGIFLKRSNNLMSLIGTQIFFAADISTGLLSLLGHWENTIPYRVLNPILGIFISIKS